MMRNSSLGTVFRTAFDDDNDDKENTIWQEFLDDDNEFGQSKGLTTESIQKFEHFDANETLVGEQGFVCMSDLKIETSMVRLECYVDHILCETCVEKWFKEHKTCPMNSFYKYLLS